MKKLLAIDWGTKQIGLAISRSGILVEELPATTVNHALERVLDLVTTEKIEKIIIGLPASRGNHSNPQKIPIKQFGKLVQSKSSLPIVYENEAFTSDEAKRIGGSHSLAAKLILEQFLNHAK